MSVSCEDALGYYRYEDLNYTIIDLLRRMHVLSFDATTLLVIGCGRGRFGLEIERLRYRVTGLNNS